DEFKEVILRTKTLFVHEASFNLNTRRAELDIASAIDRRVGIGNATHHTGDTGFDQGIGTRWRGSPVATGFQCHISCRTSCIYSSSLCRAQRGYFSVPIAIAGLCVPSTADASLFYQHAPTPWTGRSPSPP